MIQNSVQRIGYPDLSPKNCSEVSHSIKIHVKALKNTLIETTWIVCMYNET